jgi:LysR family transcriptional regulator of gallate degradation
MPSANLHHLRAFHAVATTGGVQRAAAMLYRTSSAVTRAVAILEASLSVQLFERKGRRMLLTRAGEAVSLRARRIETELRDVHDDAVRVGAREGCLVTGIEALFNERRLRVATLLDDIRHMPTVARAMGMSHSGASRALARLEVDLGQSLFRHTAHGMLPSDCGSRWILRFNRVLAELDHVFAEIAVLDGVLEGVVTVGTLPLARTVILPSAIVSLLRKHPRLQVRSLESTYEELIAGVLSGRVDFIIAPLGHPAHPGLASMQLMQDQPALIARAGHPLAIKTSLSFEDIERYGWVLPRADAPLHMSLERFYRDSGRTLPAPAVETGDLALLRGLLLSSDMIALLSPHQVYHEMKAGEFTMLPFTLPGMERQIGIVTRDGAQLSPGTNALLADLSQAAAAYSSRGND